MGKCDLKSFLMATAICAGSAMAATVSNPIIWGDVPDVSTIRVGDAYYMVSTTMHFAPGVPVMKSTDLAQWRIVSYAYETLVNNDEMNLNGGKNAYGKGSWASSLVHHDGYFYIMTPSYTSGKTHVYKTKDVESGEWSETTLPRMLHDPSLFFDDDGSVFVFYGNASDGVDYIELNSDVSGFKSGGRSGKLSGTSVASVTGSDGLFEGSQMFKVNGEYYLFRIAWPSGKCRTEIVYRSSTLLGTYSGKIFLQNDGVAQGGIFDTPEGKWYAMLFRDSGPVGRIPYLIPMSWQDGWPVADGGKAPQTLELPESALPGYGLVTSDDFESSDLALEWQWNHNPDNSAWSTSANPGHLRLTTTRTDDGVYTAKNTLTQRTFGPECSGRISVDAAGMKDGDIAGLVALQDTMGFVGVKKTGNSYSAVMYHGTSEVANKPLQGSSAYFRIDFSLPLGSGTATYYYSEDGKTWSAIGDKMNLSYTLGMFVGYRFGLFHYATKTAGGYADFDWFKIGSNVNDEIYLDNTQDVTPPEPYGGTPATIPGKIEVENYDVGKSNKAYYDSDSQNQGEVYREEGVDVVQVNPDDATEGYAIGYTQSGEWLRYTVSVEASGKYFLQARVASGLEGSGFRLYMDDAAITDSVQVPQGESWDTYETLNIGEVELFAGEHTLKLVITGSYVNIDWIQFCVEENCADRTGIMPRMVNLTTPKQKTAYVFGITGKFLGKVTLSGENLSSDLKNSGYATGSYLIRVGNRLQRVNVAF
ncbi:MAG: family 43 glycosylhydrolase [Fibrobacter sp.]|nr:family 43 glycosylhydrolase [Fibrobacter sp.]